MNRRIHIDMQVHTAQRHVSERSINRVGGDHISDRISEKRADAPVAPRLCATLKESQLKTYGSRELFDGSREVGIEHGGSLYRLKITRQGKLILNK